MPAKKINRVSERLFTSVIGHLYHGKNKLQLDEMIMISALYRNNTLRWIFIVLAQWSNSLQVDMALHLDALFWFPVNQFYSLDIHA